MPHVKLYEAWNLVHCSLIVEHHVFNSDSNTFITDLLKADSTECIDDLLWKVASGGLQRRGLVFNQKCKIILTEQDVLISRHCGKGSAKKYHQRRTLIQYTLLAAAGLATFYKSENPRLRAAGLGLLFPGAGFVAVCTIPSILSLIVTLAAVPIILFMWFGCGGLVFPITLWTGSLLAASFLARDTVLESAGTIVTAACVLGISFIVWKTQVANGEAEKKRDERNAYLINAVKENDASATPAPAPGTREADERSLRFLQWVLEMGLAPQDDFSYHDVIDQFQTSAIRYQLYQGTYELSSFQSNYCPCFHG